MIGAGDLRHGGKAHRVAGHALRQQGQVDAGDLGDARVAAAGLAVGFWSDLAELSQRWSEAKRWEPRMHEANREREYSQWKRAVSRSLDWAL